MSQRLPKLAFALQGTELSFALHGGKSSEFIL